MKLPTDRPRGDSGGEGCIMAHRAHDNRGGESAERKKELGRANSGGGDLQAAVSLWNTPNLPNGGGKTRGGNRSHELLLAGQAPEVTTWATPRANDPKDGASHGEAPTNSYLSRQAPRSAINGRTSLHDGRTSRPRLNPAFVCWLMGWPWWWTNPARISFAAAEMESWRCKLRSRLRFLLEG